MAVAEGRIKVGDSSKKEGMSCAAINQQKLAAMIEAHYGFRK